MADPTAEADPARHRIVECEERPDGGTSERQEPTRPRPCSVLGVRSHRHAVGLEIEPPLADRVRLRGFVVLADAHRVVVVGEVDPTRDVEPCPDAEPRIELEEVELAVAFVALEVEMAHPAITEATEHEPPDFFDLANVD